jgi:hypothetical protein
MGLARGKGSSMQSGNKDSLTIEENFLWRVENKRAGFVV